MSQIESQMSDELLRKYMHFKAKMQKAGLPFILTSVARDYKTQFALYSQGREPVHIVNGYRKLAGLKPISESENKIVTWTLKSKHIVNLDDGIVENDKSRAFDFALVKTLNNKIPHWDLKANVNNNEQYDYLESAEIATSCGLIAGAFFRKPDYCHVEI